MTTNDEYAAILAEMIVLIAMREIKMLMAQLYQFYAC